MATATALRGNRYELPFLKVCVKKRKSVVAQECPEQHERLVRFCCRLTQSFLLVCYNMGQL